MKTGKRSVFGVFVFLFLGMISFVSPVFGSDPIGAALDLAVREPENMTAQAALARAYNLNGEPGKAYSAARSVLQRSAEHAAALLELGHAARMLGKYEESAEYYRRYLASHPLSLEALAGNSENFAMLGLWSESLAAAMTAVRIAPERPEGYGALGRVYRIGGRFDEAIDVLQQGLKIEKDRAALLFDLGMCFAEQGNRGAAFEIYKQLVPLDRRLAGILFESVRP
jgi:tetratricopeptide (TPR) repeat protein